MLPASGGKWPSLWVPAHPIRHYLLTIEYTTSSLKKGRSTMKRKQKVIQMSPAVRQVLEDLVRKQAAVEVGVPRLFIHLPARRMSGSTLDGSTLRAMTWGDIALQPGHTVARIPDLRTLATAVSEQPMAVSQLQEFARHSHYMVRWSVVLNPAVSGSILATLARDPVEFVRREVARHVLTPPAVLHRLSQDPVLGVRYAVATNPNTEWNTLKQMVGSKSQRIVRAIANHPNTPADHPLKSS